MFPIIKLILTALAWTLAALALFSLILFWRIVKPVEIANPLTPKDLGLLFEDVRFTTSDNVDITGWFIPSNDQDANRAVVLLHGYPANKSDLLGLVQYFHEHSHILLMDFRSFGQSSGGVTTLGAKEVHDAEAAVDYLAAQEGVEQVVLFGFSIGAAVAVETAATRPAVSAVIAEAPYDELRTLAHSALAVYGPVKYPVWWFFRLWGTLFLGTDPGHVRPAQTITRLRTPIMIVHGEQDTLIPMHASERLLSRSPASVKQLVRVLHGTHGSAFVTALEEQPSLVTEFFNAAFTQY